jgi:hypothetical protein
MSYVIEVLRQDPRSACNFDPRIASSANVTLIAQSVLTIRRRLIG